MSISITIVPFLDNADAIISYLMPVFNLIVGVSLGFVVVGKIIGAFRL